MSSLHAGQQKGPGSILLLSEWFRPTVGSPSSLLIGKTARLQAEISNLRNAEFRNGRIYISINP